MATTRREVIDDNGNIIDPPDPTSDVGQIIYLLEYARLRGFRIGPTVQVGDAIVQVVDLRQQQENARSKEIPEADVWEAHGHVEK